MKKYLLTGLIIIIATVCSAQTEIKDSVFVRINQIPAEKLFYDISNGKITLVNIDIKSRYKYFLGFISSYFNSDLIIQKKDLLNKEKVISYETYNEMLNKDFMNIYLYQKTYFIISEDKYSYLLLQVRPILPPELNQM